MIALGKKQLTSTDITNGYLSLSNSSSSNGARTVIFGFYGCAGFATAGSMTFRSGSSNTISAAATTAATGQKVVVIRFEKSSDNPGPALPSPAATLLTQWYTNAAAALSYYFEWYDGPAATITFTDPVASANGTGVQIALIDSSVSTSPTVSVWDGTSEVTGCTVSVWSGTCEVAGSTVEIV